MSAPRWGHYRPEGFPTTLTRPLSDREGKKAAEGRGSAVPAWGGGHRLSLLQGGKLRHTWSWTLLFEHRVEARPTASPAHDTSLSHAAWPPPGRGSEGGVTGGPDRLGTNQQWARVPCSGEDRDAPGRAQGEEHKLSFLHGVVCLRGPKRPAERSLNPTFPS